jgi:hypothetical protein
MFVGDSQWDVRAAKARSAVVPGMKNMDGGGNLWRHRRRHLATGES